MSENVRPLRSSVPLETATDREIVLHVAQKLEELRAMGCAATGIAFVLFYDDANGNPGTSVNWDTKDVAGPSSHALAYAALRLEDHAKT